MRSLEWTTYSEATCDTALEQACVVLRFFLGKVAFTLCIPLAYVFATASGLIKLAQSVLEMLPAEPAGISEPEERATEYLHYRQFFIVWESLERVVAFQALEVDINVSQIGTLYFPLCLLILNPFQDSIGASRETRAAWLSDYHDVLNEANEQVVTLLTVDCQYGRV